MNEDIELGGSGSSTQAQHDTGYQSTYSPFNYGVDDARVKSDYTGVENYTSSSIGAVLGFFLRSQIAKQIGAGLCMKLTIESVSILNGLLGGAIYYPPTAELVENYSDFDKLRLLIGTVGSNAIFTYFTTKASLNDVLTTVPLQLKETTDKWQSKKIGLLRSGLRVLFRGYLCVHSAIAVVPFMLFADPSKPEELALTALSAPSLFSIWLYSLNTNFYNDIRRATSTGEYNQNKHKFAEGLRNLATHLNQKKELPAEFMMCFNEDQNAVLKSREFWMNVEAYLVNHPELALHQERSLVESFFRLISSLGAITLTGLTFTGYINNTYNKLLGLTNNADWSRFVTGYALSPLFYFGSKVMVNVCNYFVIDVPTGFIKNGISWKSIPKSPASELVPISAMTFKLIGYLFSANSYAATADLILSPTKSPNIQNDLRQPIAIIAIICTTFMNGFPAQQIADDFAMAFAKKSSDVNLRNKARISCTLFSTAEIIADVMPQDEFKNCMDSANFAKNHDYVRRRLLNIPAKVDNLSIEERDEAFHDESSHLIGSSQKNFVGDHYARKSNILN